MADTATISFCSSVLSVCYPGQAAQSGRHGKESAEREQQDEIDARLHFGNHHARHVISLLEDGAHRKTFSPDADVDIAGSAVIVLAEAGKRDRVSGLQFLRQP